MKLKRVAFTMIGGASWTGGNSYLVNLLGSIDRYQSDYIRPVLFCGEDVKDGEIAPFLKMNGVDVIRSSVFNDERSALRLAMAVVWGIDREAVELFRSHSIDVAFEPATFYGWRCPIPAIAWLPDFQHRRMREQFGAKAYWRRELGYRAQIYSMRIVMLSSEDARRDCERFYPASVGRTAVVRFAAPLNPALIEEHPQAVFDEYRLPGKFFYLPNQFWQHKNHIAVIGALGLLKQQGCDIVVVASGNPVDPRHPDHFDELNRRIEGLGLKESFRMLGMVPRRKVVSLMRTCSALVNPSFFEGWSSTVEEARSLGVPMLLSDIAVHREQMGDGAIYFDPTNIKDLALKLMQINLNGSLSSTNRQLTTQGDENVRRFASDFAAVVQWASSTVQV